MFHTHVVHRYADAEIIDPEGEWMMGHSDIPTYRQIIGAWYYNYLYNVLEHDQISLTTRVICTLILCY